MPTYSPTAAAVSAARLFSTTLAIAIGTGLLVSVSTANDENVVKPPQKRR